MMSLRFFALLVSTAVLMAAVLAGPIPAGAAGYQEIDAPEVRRMMENGDPLVVFPLSRIEYNDLHIEGSVHIPLEDLEQGLPDDQDRPLIFYCIGIKCTASWRAAEKAADLGFKEVYAFREGLPAWVEEGFPTRSIEKLPEVEIPSLTTEQLSAMLLGGDDFVLLDVSLERDARKFWIESPHRLHIPTDDMGNRYGELPQGKKVVVICLKGKRAPTIARYLTAKGFDDLYTVKGGMEAWILEGRPVGTAGS